MRFDETFIRGSLSDVSIVNGSLLPVDPFFAVDSRLIKPNELFVAVSGNHTDGHLYLEDALKNGASGLMISHEKKSYLDQLDSILLKNKLVLVVNNTINALITLASEWRKLFKNPVVGITGSVGKTSTKEVLAAILKENKNSFYATQGSQNTRIGLSINILHLKSDDDFGVFEMGISHRGEMDQLAGIAKPTIAIITNIGHSHMEGLGSLQDIAIEKRAIFNHFTEKNIGVIFGDQEMLSTVSYSHPVVRFGSKTTNQIQARKIQFVNNSVKFYLKIYKNKYAVTLDKPHMGTVYAALAAATAAHLLLIDNAVILNALQKPVTVSGRFEKRKLKNGGILINDCYNANPESVKAALLAFEQIDTSGTKILVLGDMLELGVNAPFWHRQIGRFLRKITTLKKIILVGSLVHWVKKNVPLGVETVMVASWEDAQTYFDTLDKSSILLVKGSNGVGLLNLVKKYSHVLSYAK